MFGSSKPSASLSSGLLARKGQARPAMRPQGFHTTSMNLEDLGWNDMGEEAGPVVPLAPIVDTPTKALPAARPPVLVERAELEEAIAPTPAPAPAPLPEPTPVSMAVARRLTRDVQAKAGKAAFTLRLDPDRHLRLRLASATRHRSSQALMIDALDALLATLPEIEHLADQLKTDRTAAQGGKA
ncbi:hypothetical protein SAMN06297144_2326 [Sphingomonas guangdongensis]|uniref:Uncharacterized protein n=1 Tax=Sphingomonas guangdongensis TaxID=1141890 RepID=A0A285R4B4_9SPHN|nr:hypothetical protein [Sphingomonas guangdongensis]SOB87202.1 hypothetical protein SAMN06297144_2326 [Sphingomonas guangdongensis]